MSAFIKIHDHQLEPYQGNPVALILCKNTSDNWETQRVDYIAGVTTMIRGTEFLVEFPMQDWFVQITSRFDYINNPIVKTIVSKMRDRLTEAVDIFFGGKGAENLPPRNKQSEEGEGKRKDGNNERDYFDTSEGET